MAPVMIVVGASAVWLWVLRYPTPRRVIGAALTLLASFTAAGFLRGY